jgi:hypothetical protein
MLPRRVLLHPEQVGGGRVEVGAPTPAPAVAAPTGPVRTDVGSPKIRPIEQRLMGGAGVENWQRPTNVTGTGATHVKSFHCKLTGESLEFLDKQINDWLEAHPQYEVKFVSSAIGEWSGKIKEPNLIVQLWV